MRESSTGIAASLEPAHAATAQKVVDDAHKVVHRVFVLGGDGFMGWPTALHLSAQGYRVTILDNLSRRNIDNELEVESLTPIWPMSDRLRTWKELTGQRIDFIRLDVAKQYDLLADLIYYEEPDAIVHMAEQRAAPYSMKSAGHKRYTVENNVTATHNILAALVHAGVDAHVVHIGTMGVYGYGTAGSKIPEGYLGVQVIEHGGPSWVREIRHPTNPGSVYHMTKCLDQEMFAYYAKNDGLRITDLHQGIVWGTQTPETSIDEALINRFDYDGDYGTVLNRFLAQAAVCYPLTVHGTGGQTRAFIHIRDSVQCIRLALENAPERGDRVRIMNQMTECHRVRDLAAIVAGLTKAEIAYVPNPRKEDAENELLVANDSLLRLGLEPTTLEVGLLDEIVDIAERYRHRIDVTKIPCVSTWTYEQQAGVPTDREPSAPAPHQGSRSA